VGIDVALTCRSDWEYDESKTEPLIDAQIVLELNGHGTTPEKQRLNPIPWEIITGRRMAPPNGDWNGTAHGTKRMTEQRLSLSNRRYFGS
jgi:hypothetical protein